MRRILLHILLGLSRSSSAYGLIAIASNEISERFAAIGLPFAKDAAVFKVEGLGIGIVQGRLRIGHYASD